MNSLDPWVQAILADPITKQSRSFDSFKVEHGVLDARVFLKNTHGYSDWAVLQDEYENRASRSTTLVEEYRASIDYNRPVYMHYRLEGRILDCGGGAGVVREFLASDIEYVSIDPFLMAPFASSAVRKQAYRCLNQPLNFIAANAEFLPFLAESFDWVHMQSMLDHVHVPDLVLLEAHRVLRSGGHILVGMYVEGGKRGLPPLAEDLKHVLNPYWVRWVCTDIKTIMSGTPLTWLY